MGADKLGRRRTGELIWALSLARETALSNTGSTTGLGLYSCRQTEMALPGEALRENSTGAGVGSKLLS